mmetsp:Transcript_4601/g.7058  ORF Transcript_4601/g.7058 Transcript_4601/m.7058 type:complete len:83 (+) Transcript_4601:104-352(+)
MKAHDSDNNRTCSVHVYFVSTSTCNTAPNNGVESYSSYSRIFTYHGLNTFCSGGGIPNSLRRFLRLSFAICSRRLSSSSILP